MAYYFLMFFHLLLSTTIHGTRPIISLFANDQGGSTLIIGMLVSIYALLPMLLAINVGKALDTYGARVMIFIGMGGMLFSYLLPILVSNIGGLFISQAIVGLSFLMINISLQKTVGNLNRNRDQSIATFTFVGSTGSFLGPMLNSTVYEYFGFQFSFLLSFSMTLGGLLIVFFLHKRILTSPQHENGLPDERSKKQHSSWLLLKTKNLRHALIIGGMVLYSRELFVGYFPIYGKEIGLSASSVGLLISVMGLMTMLIRFFQFQLVKIIGRGKLLFLAMLISGGAYCSIPFLSEVFMLAFIIALLGAGLGLGQPLSLVYVLNISSKEIQGKVLGLRMTINRTSQFVAPLVFGAVGTLAGVSPIFWLSGGILLLSSRLTRDIL